MTKQGFAVVLSFFLLQIAKAEEKFWTAANDQTEFHSLYFQDGVWRIDHFKQDEDGFLELTKRQSFRSPRKAQNSFSRLKQQAPPQTLQTNFNLSSPRLVKGFLWEATEQWNWQWEIRYARWVRDHANKQFFADHKLPADCADAAFAFRWIFARIHRLPAANHLANGQWMTHETYRKSWARLPQHADWQQDQRFLKALNDLLDSTYTHTLMRDSYPVAINAESFREGIHHLSLSGTSGHTMIVNQVNANSKTQIPLKLIWATVPRDLANLTEGGFWNSALPEKNVSGFFRVLWPKWQGTKWVFANKNQIPHYSEEQYQDTFLGEETSFAMALIKKLSPEFDPVLIYKNGLDLILTSIQQRIQVAQEGFAYCSSADCSEGTANYENWSTPSRDKRLRQNFKELETFLGSVQQLTSQPSTLWKKALSQETVEVLGETYSLGLLRTLWLAKAYSSEPWDPLHKRWPFRPKDFLAPLRKKFDQAIQQRQLKVANNPCLQSACTKNSALHQEYSTDSIDQNLRVLFLNAVYFCKNTSLQDCQNFKDLLAFESFDNEPLLKALFRSHYYSSDANDSLAERWGQHLQNNSFDLLLGVDFYFENENGFLAKQDQHSGELFYKQQHRESFPTHQRMVHLFTNGEVLLKNTQTQTLLLYEDGQTTDTGIAASDPVVRLNSKTLQIGSTLIHDGHSGPQIHHSVPHQSYLNLNNEKTPNFLVFEEAGTLKAHYFHTGNMITVEIGQRPLTTEGFEIQGVAQTDKALLFQIINRQTQEHQAFRFLKTTLTLEPYQTSLKLMGAVTDTVLLAQESNATSFYVLKTDRTFNELARQSLPGYPQTDENDPSVFWVNRPTQAYLYRHLQDLKFESQTISKTENQSVQSMTAHYFVMGEFDANPPSGRHVVYDYKTQTAQFEADYVTRMPGPKNSEFFWVLSIDPAGSFSQYATWNQQGRWPRLTPGRLSPYPMNHLPFEPVDGELPTGGGFIYLGQQTTAPLYQSLSSILMHLPGQVVVSISE